MYLDELAARIRAAVPDKDQPDGDTRELYRMYAVLALALGQSVKRADVHNAWVAWMAGRNSDHEALVPYEQLPGAVRSQDEPYMRAIHSVVVDLEV